MFAFQAKAQKFRVDTLFKGGNMDNRVNIVILGDGFTDAEMPKFRNEASQFASFFLGYEPYNHYKNYFNFYCIRTPSRESGITNPGTAPDRYPDQPVGTKNTFFGATFGLSIHRLVTVGKYDVLYNVLATNLPNYDLVVVLANTPWYGGSGGSIAVHTLDANANTIGVHEIGHTFAHLNDEYWAGPGYGWEAPNMTIENNPALIKWKNWLNTPNIGIFKHGQAEAAIWNKPTEDNCLMEFLHFPFCAVCREATTERILEIVNPVESVAPDTATTVVLQENNEFRLNLLSPEPNTLKTSWTLNGELISNNNTSLLLQKSKLGGKTGILQATVFDDTFLSRTDNRATKRSHKITWKLAGTGKENLVLIASPDSICHGESVTITAYGCTNGKLKWSTGDSTQFITITPEKSASYSAVCKVPGSENLSDSLFIYLKPSPLVTAFNGGPYYEGSSIQLSATGGATYRWKGPQNFNTTIQNPVIINAATYHSGIYQVTAQGLNGCSAIASTEVKVDYLLATNPSASSQYKIFPNPASENIHIETALSGRSNLRLIDINGREILKKTFTKNTTIDAQKLTPGIYLIRIRNGAKEISEKVAVR